MYLSKHCCLIVLLSFVSGVLAQSRSVTVHPATAKLREDVTMNFTFTPAGEETLGFLSWFKCNEAGEVDGLVIISNLSGNPEPNGRYSLGSDGELIISNMTQDDNGTFYLCRVTTSPTGSTAEGFSNIILEVDPPNVEPPYQCMCESTTSTFTCIIPDNVPRPFTITWIKDGVVLDVSDTEKYPQSDTTLEISRFNKKDEGDYQCYVHGETSVNEGTVEEYNLHKALGFSFIALGIASMLVGAGICIYVYYGGGCDLKNNIWFRIGFALFVIGVVLFVLGLILYFKLCDC